MRVTLDGTIISKWGMGGDKNNTGLLMPYFINPPPLRNSSRFTQGIPPNDSEAKLGKSNGSLPDCML